MNAAIAIDKYKLPVFSKRLVEAGFHYEQLPGVTSDSLMLSVTYKQEDQQKLAQLVLAANKEATKK